MIRFAFWKGRCDPHSSENVWWRDGGAEGVMKMLGGLDNSGARRGKKEAEKKVTGQEKRRDSVSPILMCTLLGSPACHCSGL